MHHQNIPNVPVIEPCNDDDVVVVTDEKVSKARAMEQVQELKFPGWSFVFDDLSKEHFFQHNVTGKIIFAAPDVDPNALS